MADDGTEPVRVSDLPRKNMTFNEDVHALLGFVGELEDVGSWRVLDALVRMGVEAVLNIDDDVLLPAGFALVYLKDAGLDEEKAMAAVERICEAVKGKEEGEISEPEYS